MWWRRRSQRDFEDEIRAHLELEADQLAREGISAPEARLSARRKFGNVGAAQERFHDTARLRWLEHLVQDLRYGTRMLRKAPGFATVAVVTLSLGIGATTAVFSVVNGVLLNPLPYKAPEQLVMLWESLPAIPRIMISYPDYQDWRARTHSFTDIAIYSPFRSFTMTGHGAPERISVGLASANLFDLLGVAPTTGRGFGADDDRPGATPVALLASGFWRRRFGADSAIVGHPLTLSGETYTIIGIVPPTFGLGAVDVWIPAGLRAATPEFDRSNHPGLIGLGRLKPGVTVELMQGDLTAVARQLVREHPKDNAGIGASGRLWTASLFRSIKPALRMLSAGVALVLLIACVNVANLLLSRATTRRKEIALRIAIGASRSRILRLLMTESLVLALAGGAGGVALAYGGVRLLLALKPTGIPRLAGVHIDLHVLAFALVASIVTGVLFGLVPSFQTSRVELQDALKESGRAASATSGALRMREALMAIEVALALVLIVGAGLFMRSFARLTSVDPGVDPSGVVVASLGLPHGRYPTEERQRLTLQQILARVQTLPSVATAALTSDLPLNAGNQIKITFEGHPRPKGQEPLLNRTVVTPEYFTTVRMRVVAGRGIERTDVAGAPRSVVVGESVARTFFPGENPVGRRIKHGPFDSAEPEWTVVGVVNEVKDGSLAAPSLGTIYFPFAQDGDGSMWLAARSSAPAERLFPMLRHEVAQIDRELALAGETTLEAWIAQTVAQPRFTSFMLAIFAAVALLLAAVGIYGVISYIVAQRAQEIGIRMALGARAGDVLTLVTGRALGLTLVGLFGGVMLALLAKGLVAKLLFDIAPTDRATYAGGCIVLLIVALVAAAVPAARAIRLNPAEAVRAE